MAEKAEIVISAKDSTASAFQSVQANLTKAQAAVAGFAGGLAGGVVQGAIDKLTSAFASFDVRGIIDANDRLNDLSKKTGIAVDVLGGLGFAAKQSGGDLESISSAAGKLNKSLAEAAAGNKEVGEAFKVLGLSAKDAAGNTLSADVALRQIADKFAAAEDGPEKAAIALRIFGKAGADIIPLLDEGGASLQANIAYFQRYSGVTTETAEAADRFNDSLGKVALISSSFGQQLTAQLLPTLQVLVARYLEVKEKSDAFETASRGLSDAFKFVVANAITLVAAITSLAEGVGAVLAAAVAAANGDFKGARVILEAYSDSLDNAAASSSKLQAEVLNAGKAAVESAKSFRELEKASYRSGDFSDFKPKPKLGRLSPTGGGGATDPDGILRKQLDGRIRGIEAALERERDLFAFQQSQLQSAYGAGEASFAQFFDGKARIQQQALAATKARLQEEVAAFEEAQAKAKKPETKQDFENKRADALAKLAKFEREAGQAAEEASDQRRRAAEEANRALKEIDAQIAELSGNRLAGELAQNLLRVAAARKEITKAGGDQSQADALGKLLDQQSRFNEAVRENSQISERAQTAEEAFLQSANRQGLSRLETEEGVRRVRQQSLAQLDELIAKTEQLLAVSTDPEQIAFLARLKVARENAFNVADPGALRLQKFSEELGNNLSRSFEDAIVEGGKFSDVLKGIEKDFVRLVTRDFLTTPLATSMSNFVKNILGAGGQQSGGAGGGDLFSLVGKFLGLFAGGGGGDIAGNDIALSYHGGGIAGASGGTMRKAEPRLFENANRYHRGGLASNEVRAVLQKGEEVLTKADPRHRNNLGAGGRPMQLVQNFTLQQPASRETQSQVARRAGLGIQQAMGRDN